MGWKLVTVAVFAAVTGLHAAQGQTVAQIGDPAELPPAGFKGDQFIDSRGCVFMRISNGGQAQWYPRVDQGHKVVCGYPPTFGPHPQVAIAAAETPAVKPAPQVAAAAPAKPAVAKPAAVVANAKPAPAAKPVAVAAAPAPKPATGAPVATVASNMRPAPVMVPVAVAQQPAPYVSAAPAQYEVATSASIPPGKIGCFQSAPVAEVVTLRSGGTAVVCTRGDGTMTGWRSPIYPANAPVGAALRSTPAATAPAVRMAAAPAAPRLVAVAAAPSYTVPKGYKLAWDDDRLNPLRGQGTAEGWAQQDQVWTRTVPAQLVTDATNPRAAVAPVYRTQVSVSSKNAPAAQPAVAATRTQVSVSSMNAPATTAAQPAKAARLWVQVGSFGVPENAQGAASQLSALGLPVGKSNLVKGGKALQIVFAGPFGSTADAQSALQLARQAGFADAFVR